WFEDADGQVFVLAKKDFPRPLLNAERQTAHLNRANYSGYLTEPLSAIIHHRDTETQREIEKNLAERADLPSENIFNESANRIFILPRRAELMSGSKVF
ncbi:MAG: hypothetical protein HC846_10760, partial [Blastocatellia bacterium]|nr:hypothetical protein [Blastocatellia bacterium]